MWWEDDESDDAPDPQAVADDEAAPRALRLGPPSPQRADLARRVAVTASEQSRNWREPMASFWALALSPSPSSGERWRLAAAANEWRPTVEDLTTATLAQGGTVAPLLQALQGATPAGCGHLISTVLLQALTPHAYARSAAVALATEWANGSPDDGAWLPDVTGSVLSACSAPFGRDALRLASIHPELSRSVATALLDRDYGGASAQAQTRELMRWTRECMPDPRDPAKYWRLQMHLQALSLVFPDHHAFPDRALRVEMSRAIAKVMQTFATNMSTFPQSGHDAVVAMSRFGHGIDSEPLWGQDDLDEA